MFLVRHRRASPWPGWVEPSTLFCANVGYPSSGKSPALEAVVDIVRELQAELNADLDERRRQQATDRLGAKLRREKWETDAKAAVAKGFPPPLMPADCAEPEEAQERRLTASDATPEKLVQLVAGNQHGLLYVRDELSGWIAGMDRYTNARGAERAMWLEAYQAQPYVVDRQKSERPVSCDAMGAAPLGGIQPDRLKTLLLAGDDDGLTARFLYCWPERVPPRRPDRAANGTAARDALRKLLHLERTVDGKAKVLPLDDAAADAIQKWREDVSKMEANGATGLLLSWLGKLPGFAVRLSLAIEHLWWAGDQPAERPAPTKISERAVLAAVAFLESYALPMARRVFADGARPQNELDAATLGKWVISAFSAKTGLPKMINAKALRRASVLHTQDAQRYDAALLELTEAAWVLPAGKRQGAGKGRPSKDFDVNPRLGAWQ
jgi:hypothetical protein